MITWLIVTTLLTLIVSRWYFERVATALSLREPYAALFFEQAERLMMRNPPEVVENILLSLGASIIVPGAPRRIADMLEDTSPMSEEAYAKRLEVDHFVQKDEDTRRIFFEAVHSGLYAVSYSSIYYGPSIRQYVDGVAEAPERKENIAITIEERTPLCDLRSGQLLAA